MQYFLTCVILKTFLHS